MYNHRFIIFLNYKYDYNNISEKHSLFSFLNIHCYAIVIQNPSMLLLI